MKNPWIFPAATLIVGAIGGFISGKNASPAGEETSAENAAVRTRSSIRAESSTADVGKRSKRPAGLAEIGRMPGSSNRIQALMEYYSSLSPEQLEEEARKLDNLPMNERIMASFLLFGHWAEVDPTAAMAFSNTMGFGGAFVRPTILQSWASVDPANAARYYAENPREFAMMGMMGGGRGPMGGQGPASIIASEWARQDPAAALAWASTLTTEKGQAMNAVVGEVAKTDPKKAAEMLASMDSPDKGDAYRTVAAQYGAMNFSEAQAWIRSSLPADQQEAALASAIEGLSREDPVAAAREALLMGAGDAQNRAISALLPNLARTDPQAAADLIAKQDEQAQQNSIGQLMSAWVAQDPGAALIYAQNLTPGPVQDRALIDYVRSNYSADPKDLLKVASGIQNERDQNQALFPIYGRWMREDPVAARASIQQSTTLSDRAKERILEGRGMWGGGRRGRGGN